MTCFILDLCLKMFPFIPRWFCSASSTNPLSVRWHQAAFSSFLTLTFCSLHSPCSVRCVWPHSAVTLWWEKAVFQAFCEGESEYSLLHWANMWMLPPSVWHSDTPPSGASELFDYMLSYSHQLGHALALLHLSSLTSFITSFNSPVLALLLSLLPCLSSKWK